MSAPNSSLSSGFFICCSWTSLGYFFLCSCNSDLCLEVPWCLECCQLVSGTGRHTMYFIKSQTLLTFHLLTRLRVSKIMPVNFIIELLDCSDQSLICGARWRTLSPASHMKNILWVSSSKLTCLLSECQQLRCISYRMFAIPSHLCAEIWGTIF